MGERTDERQRERVQRALAMRPDIRLRAPEICELLESHNPELLLLRIERDRLITIKASVEWDQVKMR